MSIKGRSIYLDYLKGLLIFLVVLGHSIQYIGYNGYDAVFYNKIFKLIYTFHMPLFLGISGYLTYLSVRKYLWYEFLKKRILTLLVPLFTWSLLHVFITLPFDENFSVADFFNKELDFFLNDYWFIWAIIFYSTIVTFLKKYHIDNGYILILVSLILMSIPFDKNFLWNMLESMFPFFALGYFLSALKLERVIIWSKRLFPILLVISALCFIYWGFDDYVYKTRSGWNNLDITIFRFIAGVILSVSFMVLSYYIYSLLRNSKALSFMADLGTETLGIYLSQGLLFFIIMEGYLPIINKMNYINAMLFILPALLLTVLLYYLVKLSSKNTILAFLLYGKK